MSSLKYIRGKLKPLFVVIILTHNFFLCSLLTVHSLHLSAANGILRQIQKCENFLHSLCSEVRRIGALLFALWQVFGLKTQMLHCLALKCLCVSVCVCVRVKCNCRPSGYFVVKLRLLQIWPEHFRTNVKIWKK